MIFDDGTIYNLNKDFNHFARMTTFNGQAVIVGIVADNYKTEKQERVAKRSNKYVEIFDSVENKWLLQTPGDKSNLTNWITQFALVPLKNNLLHIGGNDIASPSGSSSYQKDYEPSSFNLDLRYENWIKMGPG